MRKIISLFQRNYGGDRLVRDEVVPGAEWVLAGEGVPTRKYDGVCTMVRDGRLYKRLEITDEKKASGKVPPDWEPADEIDFNTGKQEGWIPVGDGPEDKYIREAFNNSQPIGNGSYEFLGPKSQGNVEGFDHHFLMPHGGTIFSYVPRTHGALKVFFSEHPDIEGIVWHHPDGRMVKIKGKDFGVRRRKREIVEVSA